MEAIKIKASADVGNSSTKVIILDGVVKRARKQPTVVSYLPTVPQFEDQELEMLVTNLHKNMIVHVTSKGVDRGGLFAVGDIANVMGGDGFNIKSHKKAERDLTLIQPLAMIATTAIQNKFKDTGELPNDLTIEVEYLSAIPVVDYSKVNVKALQERWLGMHNIIVYVGEALHVPVTVNVTTAKIVQEGIPGFYAILEGSQSMLEDYNKRYNTEFTGNNFAKRKMLFADVGEGTLELIAIVDGLPVVTKSAGHRLGVGHAAEKALVTFKNDYKFNAELTRSNFMQKVLNTNDKWHTEAKKVLESATYEQEQKIYDAIIGNVEHTLLSDVDDIVVFGGGTNVFTNLKEQLIGYADKYKMRVLWINGKEASLLNAIGLDELNNKVFFKQEAK